MNVGVLVEGHGDVLSVPTLIRRIALSQGLPVPRVLPPHRVPRSKLVKEGEMERSVELLARKVGEAGTILVLLDADTDCPAELGPALLARARSTRPDRKIEVVLAMQEYEAWFIASAVSLRGKRGLPLDLERPDDPEAIRDAKGWLGHHMTGGYSETIDRPAFTAVFALGEAGTTASFRKVSAL